nr:gamma-glutamyltransferase [Alphaproteobacteria bacterium]
MGDRSKEASPHNKGSAGRPWRQFVVASALIFLTACAIEEEPQRGTIGFVEGFIGGVATDEPRAALIGRDILSAGGYAADAATAVYFALSVTMPSQAGLGGGGVCVVRNAVDQATKTLDFLARPPRQVPAGASRPSAIPGNPRGFFALHSKFGRLRWEELVGPAEALARFGSPVSRAFAADLAQVERALLAEAPSRRIFGHSSGKRVLREGETMTQIELAAVLGRLRREGPGAFYGGTMTRNFIEAVADAGGAMQAEDLRAYRPVWRETIAVPFGDLTAHFASPPGAAGGVGAGMWRMLSIDDRYKAADESEKPHLLAESAMRAYA